MNFFVVKYFWRIWNVTKTKKQSSISLSKFVVDIHMQKVYSSNWERLSTKLGNHVEFMAFSDLIIFQLFHLSRSHFLSVRPDEIESGWPENKSLWMLRMTGWSCHGAQLTINHNYVIHICRRPQIESNLFETQCFICVTFRVSKERDTLNCDLIIRVIQSSN